VRATFLLEDDDANLCALHFVLLSNTFPDREDLSVVVDELAETSHFGDRHLAFAA
jgi:hypothetical protein